MTVDLTPELEQLVNKKIEAGGYGSATEVVGEALRLMHERDEFLALHGQEIRERIAEGYASLEKGEGIDGEEAFRELDERHRRHRDRR